MTDSKIFNFPADNIQTENCLIETISEEENHHIMNRLQAEDSRIAHGDILMLCSNGSPFPDACYPSIFPAKWTSRLLEETFLASYREKHYKCCLHVLGFPRTHIRWSDFTDETLIKLLREHVNDCQQLLSILGSFCQCFPELVNIEKLRDIHEELDKEVAEWFQEHGYGIVPPRLMFTKRST